MKNTKIITTEIMINASREKVWDTLFTRFGDTYLFNPNLEGSHFTSGNSGDIGCERQCNLDSKTYIKEKISNADKFKSFTVDVVAGNMPMVDTLKVYFTLEEVGSELTKVNINAYFTTKPAFMGTIMKAPFRARLTNMLIGLKYYLETGQAVTKQTFSSVRKQYNKLKFKNEVIPALVQ